MNEKLSIEATRDSLVRFLGMVEGTSLYVLRAIDETVTTLETEQKLMDAVGEAALAVIADIRADTPKVGLFFDPEDVVINGLEKSYQLLESSLPRIVKKKAAIDHDSRLQADRCEELHAAYDSNIESIATLIEAVKDLRAAIIAHDLAAEGLPGEKFDSVPELVRALRKSSVE